MFISGCSKSIFDSDQRDVSKSNSITHCSIYNNKTNCVATSHVLSQKEALLNQIQKPAPALIDSNCAEEGNVVIQFSR